MLFSATVASPAEEQQQEQQDEEQYGTIAVKKPTQRSVVFFRHLSKPLSFYFILHVIQKIKSCYSHWGIIIPLIQE